MKDLATILYVEDDLNLAYITKYNLERAGFKVIHISDGTNVLDYFSENSINICIIDVMLPQIDGFQVATEIRKFNDNIPIIFLTAKVFLEDKIKGLRLGADDYLTKPFHMEELILKLEIFLARPYKISLKSGIQSIGNYSFDFRNLKLLHLDETIKLTSKEAALINILYCNLNSVITREIILNAIWGNDDYFMGRSLDVFISRIRKYFHNDPAINVETIHGVGFRMNISTTIFS